MVTRPEKLFNRSVPPGDSFSVFDTLSVSSNAARVGTVRATTAAAATTRQRFRMGGWTRSRVLGFTGSRFRRLRIERAGIDRHSDHRIDAEGVELVDLLLGR